MKRGLDIVLTAATAPIWLPVAVVVSILVWATLGRPVFFFDIRAGRLGRPFRLVKFRTMRTGEGSDEERLTRVGRILRASSLDELPELWTVLRGDMSLVGPRPLPIRYLPRYTPQQNRRHEVRPGLTGWAQVNGRNALDWNEKFRYDIEYVDGMSLWLDAKIIFLTVVQVLFPRNIRHAGSATMPEFTGD